MPTPPAPILDAKTRRDIQKINAATTCAQALRAANARDCASCRATVNVVAEIFESDVKTLYNARQLRAQLLAQGQRPDPLHLSSMETIGEPADSERVRYPCAEVLALLDRQREKSQMAALALRRPDIDFSAYMLGFSSFIAHGDATSTWPFAIQADGRPLDLAEAIRIDAADGPIERLTLVEFSSRLAAVASRAPIESRGAVLLAEAPPAQSPSESRDEKGASGGAI